MACGRLSLLGGFRLEAPDGREILIGAKKNQALLAILALAQGSPVRREKLIGLLWSERGEEQARSSLRQALVVLRRELGEHAHWLVAQGEQIGLSDPNPAVDALELLRLKQAGRPDDLRQAAMLCRGPLLDGLSIRDDSFETWLRVERERIGDAAIAVFEALCDCETGPPRIEAAKRLISLDPLREQSHRVLIRAYAESGEAALAQKHYAKLAQILKQELGTKPSQETEKLLAQLGTTRPDNSHKDSETPKPSLLPVAVLPFENLGDLPDQQYLCRGITEDIVTELSRFRQLLVLSGKPLTSSGDETADAAAAGRKLGAQYVFSGSLRHMGQRIRINTRLVNAASAQLLWAEKYDRGSEELFQVQDELVRKIVSTLVGRVQQAEVAQSRRKTPASLAAYECVLQADALKFADPEANAEGRRLCQRALELDPNFARAHGVVGILHLMEWFRDMSGSSAHLDAAMESAIKATTLDPNDNYNVAVLADVQLAAGSFAAARKSYERALELNPNRPAMHAALGRYHGFAGDPEEGLRHFKKALELDPLFRPDWFLHDLGFLYFVAGRYDQAAEVFLETATRPDWVFAYAAAFHALAGRQDQVARFSAEALKINPEFSSSKSVAKDPFKRPEDRERLLQGLAMAGLPP